MNTAEGARLKQRKHQWVSALRLTHANDEGREGEGNTRELFTGQGIHQTHTHAKNH